MKTSYKIKIIYNISNIENNQQRKYILFIQNFCIKKDISLPLEQTLFLKLACYKSDN